MKPNLVYEFTKKPEYLHSYYQVRDQCYKEVWGLKIFSGAEDEHDRIGHILIARHENKVIGGGRIVMRSVDSEKKLPMENGKFQLDDVMNDLYPGKKIFGEIGRIAVLPEFRGGRAARISLYLIALAQTHQCDIITTVAPVKQALRYKEIATRLGIDIQILDDLIIEDRPYYNQIEMKLIACDLASVPDVHPLLELKS